MKITERHIQKQIYRHAVLEHHHQLIVPNFYGAFNWECDLLSVTRAGLSHEFEIKVSYADFKKDFEKDKHIHLPTGARGPNYFWYVVHGFKPTVDGLTPEVPHYAGLIEIVDVPHPTVSNQRKLLVGVVKPAPRLHKRKLGETAYKKALTSISIRFWQQFNA